MQFRQATGDVLVDSAGNFVLYETRLNPASRAYLEAESLTTAEGRAARATLGESIEFPFQHDAGPGAQLLKFAWKILTDVDDPNHYLVQPAVVSVAAKDSLDGQKKCVSVQVGLVGMHLVQRVPSGNGDRSTLSRNRLAAKRRYYRPCGGIGHLMLVMLKGRVCRAPIWFAAGRYSKGPKHSIRRGVLHCRGQFGNIIFWWVRNGLAIAEAFPLARVKSHVF